MAVSRVETKIGEVDIKQAISEWFEKRTGRTPESIRLTASPSYYYGAKSPTSYDLSATIEESSEL